MNYRVTTTDVFDKWLNKVKDRTAKAHIAKRLRMLTIGQFGDYKTVGDGVSELRIMVGKGYRVYYTLRGNELVIVLAGGIKDSQTTDIKRAKKLAKQLTPDTIKDSNE